MRAGGGKNLMADINVTPLVDVMLVLLIIFMVTAPMMMQGVEVDLPKTSTKALQAKHEQLVITVNRKGEVFIDRYRVASGTLGPKLASLRESKPGCEFFLKADKSVPYGLVVEVMAAVRRAGVKSLGMVTQPTEAGEAAR
ncbi:MAG: protein TolR [Pseudomonadota bacterium]